MGNICHMACKLSDITGSWMQVCTFRVGLFTKAVQLSGGKNIIYAKGCILTYHLKVVFVT